MFSDAGVKLLHSASGCVQCVYLTTPTMQLAFNAVPQFLCIETGTYPVRRTKHVYARFKNQFGFGIRLEG